MRILKSILAILLLVCVFASCAADFNWDPAGSADGTTEFTTDSSAQPDEPTEEDLYPEPVKQLLAENKPYSLEFTSNGDGTCYVSRLYLNNRYETAFDIIIPEKSPTGDTVTGIDLGDSLTSPYDVVPMFLTDKQIWEIVAQVTEDYPTAEGGMMDAWWINAYMEYDISMMTPPMANELIKRYPEIEYIGVFWVWYHKMSNLCDTFTRIQDANITPSVTRQYYEEFIQEARDAGAPEDTLARYKELIDALPAYANYSAQIRYVHIPSSVSTINTESLSYLMLENNHNAPALDNVIDRRTPKKGVILPAFDPETTISIYDALTGGLSPTTRFCIFSQITSTVEYEELMSLIGDGGLSDFAIYSEEKPQDNIRAWHYVDGVPTLWR